MSINAFLHKTKWGWTIHLDEIGITLTNKRNEAFYEGSPESPYENKEVNIELYYKVLYKEEPKDKNKESGNKLWATFNVNTYKEALNHPEYIRDKCKMNSIVPYYRIKV